MAVLRAVASHLSGDIPWVKKEKKYVDFQVPYGDMM